MATHTRQRILDTALFLFGKHGVSAVSLEMVAAEMGLTRQAIYRYYRDRNSLFIAAASSLHERAYDAAEIVRRQAAENKLDLADTITKVMDARFTPFLERLENSNHSDDLLAENARLVGDVAASYHQRLVDLLADVIAAHRHAEGVKLIADLSDAELARYLILVVRSLKTTLQASDTSIFRREMRLIVFLMLHGGISNNVRDGADSSYVATSIAESAELRR